MMQDSPKRVIARSSSSPTDQIVEAMARAICCPSGKCHIEVVKEIEGGKYLMDLPCYSLGPDVRESARAALSALSSQGWAVVPVEPTAEMLDAGFEAGWHCGDAERVTIVVPAVWPAMLSAAPKVG